MQAGPPISGRGDEPIVGLEIADLKPYVVPMAPTSRLVRVHPFVPAPVVVVTRGVRFATAGVVSLTLGLALHASATLVLLGTALGALAGTPVYLRAAKTRRRQVATARPATWVWEHTRRATRNRTSRRRSYQVGRVRRRLLACALTAAWWGAIGCICLLYGILPGAINAKAGVIVGAALMAGALIEAALAILLLRELEQATGWRLLTVRIKRRTMTFRTHWASRWATT